MPFTKSDALVLELLDRKPEGVRFRELKQLGMPDKIVVDITTRLRASGFLLRDESHVRPVYKISSKGREVFRRRGRTLLKLESLKRDVEDLASSEEDLSQIERELDRLPIVWSFSELINEFLAKRSPEGTHYKELTKEILRVKATKGKTPDQTILTILERGCRGNNPKYVHVGVGVYGLNPKYRPLVREATKPVIRVPGTKEFGLDLTTQLRALGIGEGDEVEATVNVENGEIVIRKRTKRR